jgi:DNA repair exonuclease SbcCD ATPase subunit
LVERKEGANVTCPECKRSVPATLYCVHCGAELPKQTSRITPATMALKELETAQAKIPIGAKMGLRELMNSISLYYIRKVALLDLLQSKGISESVFLRLYGEYGSKLSNALNTRADIMKRLKLELSEKERRLSEMRLSLEELRVRHRIGEISLQMFTEKSEFVQFQLNNLEERLKKVKEDLSNLNEMFIGIKPRDVFDFELKTKACYSALEKLIEENFLTKETAEKIRPDIRGMVEFLGSLTTDRKERQNVLQKEMEILEARYRVGEVPIEDYEKQKHELHSQMEKIWEQTC